jgi:predicted ATP-dependent endonuclease of OLD family
LLQALILSQRDKLIDTAEPAGGTAVYQRGTILGIEEPELYIHPQMQRLIFGVLRKFAETDQVIYSTHSPTFVDIGCFQQIGVVRKLSEVEGTRVQQSDPNLLSNMDDRKAFQFVTSFGLDENRAFFARTVILVEGPEDVIAILAVGRALRIFAEFPEEKGYTIIEAGNKQELKKHMKLLNAFAIPYVILHELDGNPESADNKEIHSLLGANRAVKIPNRLEPLAGHEGHFNRKYDAMMWLRDEAHFTPGLKEVVALIFEPPPPADSAPH